jgi:hypothetical protein
MDYPGMSGGMTDEYRTRGGNPLFYADFKTSMEIRLAIHRP